MEEKTKGKAACRKCEWCGRHYIAHCHNQKYCSYACRKSADGKNPDDAWRQGRSCVICGTFFFPKSSRQKTCCPRCSEENARRLVARYKHGEKVADSVPTEEEYNQEYGPDLAAYSRKCHDCGRPTNDYRCVSCRRKWRVKNKVG